MSHTDNYINFITWKDEVNRRLAALEKQQEEAQNGSKPVSSIE